MKQKTLVIVVILLTLLMSACTSGSDAALENNFSTQVEDASIPTVEDHLVDENILTTEYENAASLRNQLALGILSLKESSQAVTAEQASEILPLWQAMSLFEQDQNMAQAEVEALQSQLIKSMPAEQLQAIASMHLTNDDLAEFYADHGIVMGTESGEAQGRQGVNKDMTEDERATFRATQQASGAWVGSGVSGSGRERRSVLIDEVIALLSELISG